MGNVRSNMDRDRDLLCCTPIRTSELIFARMTLGSDTTSEMTLASSPQQTLVRSATVGPYVSDQE